MAHHRRRHTVVTTPAASTSSSRWVFLFFFSFFVLRLLIQSLLHAARTMVFGLFIATGIWLVMGVGVHTVKQVQYDQIAQRITAKRSLIEAARSRWQMLEARFPTSREVLLQVGQRSYQLGDQTTLATTSAALQRIDPNNANVRLFHETIETK